MRRDKSNFPFAALLRAVAAVVLALVLANSNTLPAAMPLQVSNDVPVWGRFETTVTNERAYDNPFRDVTLEATFTRPSGGTVSFIGFFDGDGRGGQAGAIWKLRFMPDEIGTWSYECKFSDGSPGQRGDFVCIAQGAKPGPLRAAGSKLKFADGRHFHPRGYYLSEAFTAAEPHWQQNLETFFGGKYRYNFCSTTFWQGPLLKQNRWNGLPITDFYPVLDGDYTRLDVAAWQHVDELLLAFEARGVIWHNFDGFVPNIDGGLGAQKLDPESQRVFLRNAVARLAPWWNVVWNVGFEWWEFLPAERVKQLSDEIRVLDPWKHLITVHDQGGFRTGREVADLLGVDFVTLQYDAGRCGDPLVANQMVLQYADGRPVYAHEVCWEGPDKLTGDQIRRGAWGVVLGGGILNYAEQFDQVYGNGGGFAYLEIMFDFLESIPRDAMAPHNELVNAGRLCYASPGAHYVCYAPGGGTIQLDLSAMTGRCRVEWLNPRSGARSANEHIEGGAKISFNAPDAEDWVLYVAPAGK